MLVGREAEPVDSALGHRAERLGGLVGEMEPVDSALGRRAEKSGGLVGEAEPVDSPWGVEQRAREA